MFRLAGFPAVLGLLAWVGAVVAPSAAAAVPVVTETIHVGSDPQGVAVNRVTGTVYVANLDDTVSVISGRTGTVTATIHVGSLPEGVAVNPKTGTVYVANARSGTVSVISGKTGTVTATIPVGSNPLAVAVNPMTGTVYIANFLSGTVSVISGRTGKVTATIHVGSQPDGVAVNPVTGAVYVANSGSNTVSVIGGPVTVKIGCPPPVLAFDVASGSSTLTEVSGPTLVPSEEFSYDGGIYTIMSVDPGANSFTVFRNNFLFVNSGPPITNGHGILLCSPPSPFNN